MLTRPVEAREQGRLMCFQGLVALSSLVPGQLGLYSLQRLTPAPDRPRRSTQQLGPYQVPLTKSYIAPYTGMLLNKFPSGGPGGQPAVTQRPRRLPALPASRSAPTACQPCQPCRSAPTACRRPAAGQPPPPPKASLPPPLPPPNCRPPAAACRPPPFPIAGHSLQSSLVVLTTFSGQQFVDPTHAGGVAVLANSAHTDSGLVNAQIFEPVRSPTQVSFLYSTAQVAAVVPGSEVLWDYKATTSNRKEYANRAANPMCLCCKDPRPLIAFVDKRKKKK